MDRFITNRLNVTKGLLALLIISINIREPLFHTREFFFAFLIIMSIGYMTIKDAKYAVAMMAIWCVSALYNIIVPGSTMRFINSGFQTSGFETLIVSVYLLIMCFCQERFARTIIRSYLFVSIVVALITISIWMACFLSESIYQKLETAFADLFNRTGLTFISVGYRSILGVKIFTVWYRTAPCMVCALGYCLIQRLEGRGKYTIRIGLLVAALIMSGTRADILAAILLVAIYIAYWLRKKGFRVITLVLLAVALVFALVFAGKFLNDRNSQSSAVKMSDAKTYIDMFLEDPIRTLLFGWGCGSTFFSKERGLIISASELTLFETIRRYGLLSTCIIMFGVWFTPLRGQCYRAQKSNKLFYLSALLAYIFVAFTNPYLMDSVGFCALLFFATWFRYGTGIEDDAPEQEYLSDSITG